MFGDNLKEIRKAKGYTQEELAIKLHVVRQTISKWEKGLSVPDADVLSKIADILDTSVNELLGAEIHMDSSNKNNIADQLSKINEQLAIKNRRNKFIWKVVAFIAGVILIINVVLAAVGMIGYTEYKFQEDTIVIEENVEEMEE